MNATQPYPDHPGARGDATSQEAADKVAPEAKTVREACLRILKAIGPMTADEVAAQLGLSVLTVRPRITELKRKGLARSTKERRDNVSGMSAVVVEASPEPAPAVPATYTQQELL
jgi:DNA-binding Lrp family transcriptional regulator